MSSTKSNRGRPKVVTDGASVTLTVEAAWLSEADRIAEDLGSVFAGLRQSRGDVLRAALSRGLESMRTELDRKLRAKQR